jgi:hypothetical protein
MIKQPEQPESEDRMSYTFKKLTFYFREEIHSNNPLIYVTHGCLCSDYRLFVFLQLSACICNDAMLTLLVDLCKNGPKAPWFLVVAEAGIDN